MIVISDLYDPHAAASIRRLNQTHECVVIQLRDPMEEGLRGGGVVRAMEAETGRTLVGRSRDVHSDQEELEQSFKRGGVDHLVLRTDGQIATPLRHFFESRGIFRRGAR